MTPDLSPAAIGSADELRDAYGYGDGPTCRFCGTEARTPDVTVAEWPRPLSDSPPAVVCADCWADEAARQTTLSADQAKVLAVRELGYTRREMASAIGGYEDDVDEHLEAIRDLRLEVEDEMDDLMRTAKLFDAL